MKQTVIKGLLEHETISNMMLFDKKQYTIIYKKGGDK